MTRKSVPPSEKFSNAETIRTNTYINYTESNDSCRTVAWILCSRLKTVTVEDRSIRSHKMILFAPAAVKCVFLCVSERRLKRDCFHRLLRNAYEAFGETALLEWDERPTSFKHKFQKVRVLIGFQRKLQRYAYLLAFSARKKNPISMLVSITHALPCASRASLVKRG